MLIENPEALKGWLTNVLEPMCEADPNALAKYVIALVRKDKPVNELRESCIDQLDVFLQQETKPFVEMFFKTLESKSYLAKSETTTPAPSPVNDHHVAATVPSPLPVAPLAIQTSVVTPLTNVPTTKIAERRPSRPETTTKSNEEDRDGRRVGRKLHSRSRSRSPSWSRNRSRSRSKDRDDRRGRRYPDDDRRRRPQHLGRRRYMDHRRDRSWDRDRRERERDRSHSRSRTPKSRSRSRSRSRSKDRKRASNRDSNHKAGSPNAALAVQDHGDKDYRFGPGPNPAPGATSVVSQAPGATPATATSPASTSVPSTVAIADTHPPGVQPFQPTPLTRRCRDYDEKGYCMRGDLCPFDHGADPVVVEDVNLPSMLGFGPSGPPPPPPQVPPPSVPPGRPLPPLLGPPPIPPLPQPPPPQTHSHPEPYIPEPYNPEAPTMDRMPRMRQPPFWGPRSGPGRGPGSRPLQNYPQHMTRELISVPTVDDSGDGGRVVRQHPGGPMQHPHRGGGFLGHKRPHMGPVPFPPPHLQQHQHPHLPHLHPHQHPLPPPPPGAARENVNPNEVPLNKKRAFDFNRLGPRKYTPDNSVLEIRKVPRGLNSITQLNNHFCKFGKIVNLQVSYQGDPEAALVTFSSHAEANAAYRSTEAVLNNRFIKVFWHNREEDGEQQDAKQENNVTTSLASRKVSVKDRLGTPVGDKADGSETNEPETSAVILSPTGNLSKTVFNPSALRKTNVTTANAIKSSQPVQEVLKKKQEDQHEAQKMKVDLQKRQHELLQQQIQQQKLLIEKLEKNKTTSVAERAMIITTLKILQESIDNLKKELVVVKPASSQPKTKQEAQKELLDIEMELYNKQHQGVDTSDLQKKVAELRQEALSLGLDVTRGMGQLRGRGRGVRTVVRGGMVAGVFRGRGRGTRSHAQSLQRSVDHRTRKLNVSGFEEEERDNVVAHLSQFGDVESADHDKETKKIKMSFKTRRDAEMAARKGAKFKGRVLTLSWHREPGMSQSSISEGHGGILDDDEDEVPDQDGDGNDPLLVDDEEEEDSEGRSWRR